MPKQKHPTKADVVAGQDRPFTVVPKADRRSPLHRVPVRECDHERAYTSSKFPTAGLTFVCADCGANTSYPADFG